ncbi:MULTISPECIES: peptide deformylase [unclassified Leeuwenhoekiella]|mgnify:CR=1 FL=1|uniref:peptide deformylase n=1 Tax=unclassified Leeuwenhoekiella TaxID=2615029 RepID=UPI000C377A33|nr:MULTISPECIES: peptide deformylase [unclassified Leeuwenhoekiella]MAW94894.1 peptide deformylase [Leeuwenhoekiella sp.]MBA79614.1 peptide deformylase [Leeuwenhoekiella sp.]|tara:strand:+ start:9890 stop:10477 length:588 start_codon:yes stop_codon:yes gene_type:complete
MILPIVAYGDPVLRKEAEPITPDYPGLDELIENMFETMYGASGVGLAAPQIGRSIRIFVVDATPFSDDEDLSETEQERLKNFKQAFINPEILEETGDEWAFNEGCLSIPGVNEDVFRCPNIKIKYQDADFKEHVEEFDGLLARVIQHEYDHIEGVLFTDKLSSLKKRIIKNKLGNISKGKVNADYRMRFPDIKLR